MKCAHPFEKVEVRLSYIGLLRNETMTLFCSVCGHSRAIKKVQTPLITKDDYALR